MDNQEQDNNEKIYRNINYSFATYVFTFWEIKQDDPRPSGAGLECEHHREHTPWARLIINLPECQWSSGLWRSGEPGRAGVWGEVSASEVLSRKGVE